MLETQRLLRSGQVALSDLTDPPYNLVVSRSDKPELEPLVGLKYNMIESPMFFDVCQECRGLILDSSDHWNVVSFPFRKFFNMFEPHAHDIDWETATLFEKIDGTCVVLYHYADQWNVQTLGRVDASGEVISANAFSPQWDGSTFHDLFWDAWGQNDVELSKLDPNLNYMFELCTPHNKIVVDYGPDFQLTLIGVRNRTTLDEYDVSEFSDMFQTPMRIDASKLDASSQQAVQDLIDTCLDPLGEGFVVCDENFNRVKVKSESYLFAHRTRSQIVDRKYGLLEQLLLGNHDDIIGIYPEYESSFAELEFKLKKLSFELRQAYQQAGGPNTDPNDPQERKRFAIKAQNFDMGPCIKYLFQKLDSPSMSFVEIVKHDDYRKVGDILQNM